MEDLQNNSPPDDSEDFQNQLPDSTLECFVEDSNRGINLDEERIANEIGVNVIDTETFMNDATSNDEIPSTPDRVDNEIREVDKPVEVVTWRSDRSAYPPEETWECRIGNEQKTEALFAEQAREAEQTYEKLRGASIELDPLSGPVESALDIVAWRNDAADRTSVMGEGWNEYVAGLPEPYTDPYPPPESIEMAPSEASVPAPVNTVDDESPSGTDPYNAPTDSSGDD